MWRVMGWIVVFVLCSAADVAAREAPTDARLVEARTALAEATSLADAGRYADGLARAEHSLTLREAVLGSTHPDVATSLNVIGILRWRQGQRALAEAPLLRSLAIREAALGKGHPDVASSLDGLANLYADRGLYGQAEPLYERALAIREAALGGAHPDVATSLSHLARLYQFQARYDRAQRLYERALAIREAALGRTHPDLAASLNSVATVYQLQGNYDRAEPLYQRALAIYEALGDHDIFVAYSLGNLAYLYQDEGRYDRAMQHYERSLSVFEGALGKDHPKAFDLLYSLARLYDTQGMYGQAEVLYGRATSIMEATLLKEDAEAASLLIHLGGRIDPLYERALAISEETSLGKNRPRIAASLDNTALLAAPNVLSQTEPLYQRALAVYESALGSNHPDVATLLVRFADFYQELGVYDRAEPLVRRALTIQESTFGQSSPQVAASLNNLAILYVSQRLYAQAEPLQERALLIWEKALGRNHPDVASSLTQLARTYLHQGDFRRASPLFQRALSLQESALGANHPDVALALIDLAELHQAQGAYERAEPLYQRALAIQESALGKAHPDVAITLNKLGLLLAAQQRLAEALPLLTRAFDISERLLRQEALDFSEEHMAGFLQFLRSDEERLHALLRAHPEDPSLRRLALTSVLLRKGRSVAETANTSRTVYRSLGAQDREAFDLLRSLRSQRARLSLDGPGRMAAADYQQRLEELNVRGDALETELAARSAPLRALSALPSPDTIVDRVAAALPLDAALVEFVAYTDGQLRYLALVLFADGTSRAVDLGPARPIDLAASRFRDALASKDVDYLSPSRELYALTLQPLLPLPAGVRRLFLAPDGQLGLVSFAALHDGSRFLVDAYDIAYLTSGKELLPRPQEGAPSHEVVVFAAPDFGAPTAGPNPSGAKLSAPPSRSRGSERSSSEPRAGLLEQPWPSLPGTRKEAQDIQRLIPSARLFLGQEASKDRLLGLRAPGVLHIATHGYFLEEGTTPADSRAIGGIDALGRNDASQLPSDPLLRSGLVLSPARGPVAKSGDGTASQPSDSLVTALELAGLELWGTELVVLAACDTGRGDVNLGQGVSGLRRALVVAGAETVVMSLWKVNDESTRLLMKSYYRNLLAGKSRAIALLDAMRALRKSQPHPHFWAPFISLGRDAPLRSLASLPPQEQVK